LLRQPPEQPPGKGIPEPVLKKALIHPFLGRTVDPDKNLGMGIHKTPAQIGFTGTFHIRQIPPFHIPGLNRFKPAGNRSENPGNFVIVDPGMTGQYPFFFPGF
jgi:hypothetical protein